MVAWLERRHSAFPLSEMKQEWSGISLHVFSAAQHDGTPAFTKSYQSWQGLDYQRWQGVAYQSSQLFRAAQSSDHCGVIQQLRPTTFTMKAPELPMQLASDTMARRSAAGLRRLELINAVSFREVREGVRGLRGDGSLAAKQPVLVDLRDMRFLPTTPEAEALADELSDLDGLGGHAVALLVQLGAQYGMARMVCTLAELRGGRVKAFTDDRAAVDWLMG